MPFYQDKPVGAFGGGSGRTVWARPRGGGGVSWAGGGSDVDPEAMQRERLASAEGMQLSSQAHQKEMLALEHQNELDKLGAMTDKQRLLEAQRSRNQEHAARMAQNDLEATQIRLNTLRPETEGAIQKAKLEAPMMAKQDALASGVPQTNQWYSKNADALEGVIKTFADKGTPLTPEMQNYFRQSFANKDPDFMKSYGPLFDQYANNKPSTIGNIAGTAADIATALPKAVWYGTGAAAKTLTDWSNQAAAQPAPQPAPESVTQPQPEKPGAM